MPAIEYYVALRTTTTTTTSREDNNGNNIRSWPLLVIAAIFGQLFLFYHLNTDTFSPIVDSLLTIRGKIWDLISGIF